LVRQAILQIGKYFLSVRFTQITLSPQRPFVSESSWAGGTDDAVLVVVGWTTVFSVLQKTEFRVSSQPFGGSAYEPVSLSQTSDWDKSRFGSSVDVFHEPDLHLELLGIGLVDANSIDPEPLTYPPAGIGLLQHLLRLVKGDKQIRPDVVGGSVHNDFFAKVAVSANVWLRNILWSRL
jgi:hypothetical protein